jgi:flagellar biosynthesis protein
MMNSEKKKKAVALTYVNGIDQAPHVSAKGEGSIAKKIISQAEQHNIPIQEDPALVSMLGKLDLNQIIPPELYQTVAEIFTFIYNIDEQAWKTNPK